MGIGMLVKQVGSIIRYSEIILKISGERYNIFNILKIEGDEVNLHSRLICSLLDPHGSHGFGSDFLRIFIDIVGLSNNVNEASTQVEKYIGKINDEEDTGGRIDIFIKLKNDTSIIIENKIYAPEQKNQMLRYYNYSPNSPLLYLTLFGERPTAYSTSGKKEVEERIIAISYEKHIARWLQKCIEKSASQPLLRETLRQYLNTIKQLTGDNMVEETKMEVIELITNNIEQAFTITKYLRDAQDELIAMFISQLERLAEKNKWNLKIDEEELCFEKDSFFSFEIPNTKYKSELMYYFIDQQRFIYGIFNEARQYNPESITLIADNMGERGLKYPNWAWVNDFDQPYVNWKNMEPWMAVKDGRLVLLIEEKTKEIFNIVKGIEI